MSAMAAGAQTSVLRYPQARKSDRVDTYFGTQVPDPYRWMEDVGSSEVKQWVDAENKLTQGFLAEVPARERVHTQLMELANVERFSLPERAAGRYFYTRNTGLQNQAVLYWQQGEQGTPVELIDSNTLSADATLAVDNASPSEDGTLLGYALTNGGSGLHTVHVRVVATGKDLPDAIEWVTGDDTLDTISWAHDGGGFYYRSYGVPKTEAERAEAPKSSKKFMKIYFHTLGTPQSNDKVVYERPDDGELFLSCTVTEDGRYLVLIGERGDTNTLAVRDLQHPEQLIQIVPRDDATYTLVGTLGSHLWLWTNKDAPKGRIVEVDLAHPEPASWKTVVAESAAALNSAVMVHQTLVLTYLVDASSRVEQHALDGTPLREIKLPGLGTAHVGAGRKTNTSLFYTFENYTMPATIFRLDLTTGASTVWKQPKLPFNPRDYETRQVFATSKDGTRVPIFITYKRGTKMDGTAPAILYGYGGYGISLVPRYRSARPAWLDAGGIYAEAILRGGAEYGEAWHLAGTKLHKQNVFDDFIACAEFLISNKYTSPKKLAINGQSNGGLLVGATELQRPDLFGAVLAQVGVMDMLRFDKFNSGYAWKQEYGAPSDNEADFRAILKYSPIQNAHAGTHYPATFIATADHDDTVFPAHSFKFAATLQAAAEKTPGAAPVLIRVETRAGHGGGMPLSKQMDLTADMYAFLFKELGIQ